MKRVVFIAFLFTRVIISSGQIHWTNVAYLTITGQTLQKVGNVRTEWNAGAISQESFYGDGWVEFSFLASRHAMMGLAAYNTSVNPSTINYAMYGFIDGYIQIFENGNKIPNIGKGQTIHIPYTATDVMRVERKNGVVYYKKNGNVFYTSTKPSSGPLHIDASFYQANAAITVTNHMFGLVWTGAQNQNWNNPANWNLNRVPTPNDQVIVNACSTCPKLDSDVEITALQLNAGSKIDLDAYELRATMATYINAGSVECSGGKLKSGDFTEIKNSTFTGTASLEKTGGSANSCYGGNTFSPDLEIVNSSNSNFNVATQANNIVQ